MANCSHCGSPISTADGDRGECSRCGAPVQPVARDAIIVEPVQDWPGVTRPAPRAAPPRRGWSAATILLLVFGGIFVACCGFCGVAYYYNKGVDIYVDNDSGDTLKVYVDDEHVGTVQPHTVQKVECKSGSRQVKVVDGNGNTVFDQQIALKDQQYVLNPDKKHRYWIRKLTSRFAPPEFAGKGRKKAGGPQELSFHEQLQQIMKDVQLVDGDGPWFEMPRKCNYVLGEEIPKVLGVDTDDDEDKTKSKPKKKSKDVKYAVFRIRAEDVRLLKELLDLDGEPTPQQREQLDACLKRMKTASNP